ncbi:hypothetical protein [Bacillus sp. M6-12]|uniref:hypothetical protein n=1 Tax=Bacillus sp. M6-12 TaxID=2054166 RepID=UPI0015E0862A|nr:hypothetical protein [Bacillus sp. M6-12]
MNTGQNEKVVNLSSDVLFQDKALERGFVQKIIAKKWLILRRAFFFTVGMVFYLVYSSL